MRRTYLAAGLAALTVVLFTAANSYAEVRDHRSSATVRDHRPSNAQGGVVVTGPNGPVKTKLAPPRRHWGGGGRR